MWKPIVFSVCSFLIVIAVICWIAGVFSFAPAHHARVEAAPVESSKPPAAVEDNISVYFSPNGGCTDAIVRDINGASKTIWVQAAQFTSGTIAKALVAAKDRGVDVRVIIDKGKDDDEKSEADRLNGGEVPTFVDGQHHTAHNKVILIDHDILFTGSFNFTHQAETENAENLLRIKDKPELIAAYEANFKFHLSHSKPWEK